MKTQILLLIVALVAAINLMAETVTNQLSFGIYLTRLSKEEMEKLEKTPIPLKEIPLEQVPLISERDIVAYDFNKHIIELTPEAFKGVSKVQPPSVSYGIPFVVVASGTRHYMGVFWSSLSSGVTSFPSILTPIDPSWRAAEYGTNCIQIRPPSGDKRVTTYMTLKQLGLLRKGEDPPGALNESPSPSGETNGLNSAVGSGR